MPRVHGRTATATNVKRCRTRSCSRRSQVRGAGNLIGGPIAAPVEAPQGPTCIYRPIRAKRVITLSVQSLEFARLKAQIHDLRPVMVLGRTGYCGSYGQPTVFVPLSSGRVLDVTASCS